MQRYNVQGKFSRSFWVDDSKARAGCGVIYAFHPFTFSAKKFAEFIKFTPPDNYMVVYPQGFLNSWFTVVNHLERDVKFYQNLVNWVDKKFKTNPGKRILLGWSDGACFANYLAHTFNTSISGLVSYAGFLKDPSLTTFKKFPVMIINGDLDKLLTLEEALYLKEHYLQLGHPVQYHVTDSGHIWNQIDNQVIADFIRNCP